MWINRQSPGRVVKELSASDRIFPFRFWSILLVTPVARKRRSAPVTPLETKSRNLLAAAALVIAAFVVAWISAGHARTHYDYTARIAGCFLEGRLGLTVPPPAWLNEMVGHNGRYYSVFPLGAVLSVLPFTLPVKLHVIDAFPARFVVAFVAAVITALAFGLTGAFRIPTWKRALFAFAPVFGTCLWPNLAFGGAWQIAIGFAVAGELGALFFSLVLPRPLLAGFCFAMAFGNRTEALLTAPIFYFLLLRNRAATLRDLPREWPTILRFSIFPALLGILTLAYNAARFGSPLDFGYARIDGVLDEPGYRYGIFSLQAIPMNIYHMLFEPWKKLAEFPWLVPSGWGGSLLLSSPFLVLLFRSRRGAIDLRVASWTAIVVITALLWLHGNAGGWQVGYRYASLLIPWALLILLETEPRRRIGWAPALIVVSVAINAFSTWIFCATKFMGH